jgi:hypothetical protein
MIISGQSLNFGFQYVDHLRETRILAGKIQEYQVV